MWVTPFDKAIYLSAKVQLLPVLFFVCLYSQSDVNSNRIELISRKPDK